MELSHLQIDLELCNTAFTTTAAIVNRHIMFASLHIRGFLVNINEFTNSLYHRGSILL